MHIRKWRSFLTLVKEKEVNLDIKQNFPILITQFFLKIGKIPNNNKVTAI